MATVSSSLKMFDMMTGPLQQVTQALNLTISAMDRMNNTANRDMQLTNTLNAARTATQRASTGLQELASAQDRASNCQNKLNRSFNDGANASEGLLGKVKGLAGAYIGFQAAKEAINATVGGAMRAQQQLFTIQGIMGNQEVGAAYFENLRKQANKSTFAFEDFAGNARKFMQFTKNTDSLDKLGKLSERLTLMDPVQGLEGAGFALKEMMSGDGVSLKERFGFGKADIEILKASKDMNDFISKFDTLLNKKGFTEKMLEQYNKSAAAQFNNLKSNFKTALSDTGKGALDALMPVITALNTAFNNGSFQGILNGMTISLSILADMIVWIVTLVQNNWSIIEPILIAIGLYITAMLIPAIWDAITSILAMGIAWLMVNWPIILIVGAIALLIYILIQCGVTTEQVVGFIGGIFGVFFACIYNYIAFLWNGFAAFAEFLANVFSHPLYATKALFINIWNNIVDFVGRALGAIVDMVKSVPFLKDLVGGVSIKMSSFKADAGPAPSDYWKAPRMEMKNYTNEFQYGYKKGASFATGIEKTLNNFMPKDQTKMPDLSAWNASKGPGELSMGGDDNGKGKGLKDANKHLKNIDDKIDVSNEHLEMLRDLAEQESIQNFVTLQPNVSFGDVQVKEEADINKIIAKIETYMESELKSSAEGVYA